LSKQLLPLFLIAGACFAQTTATPRFTIAGVGPLPGMVASAGTAISQSGIVAGYSTATVTPTLAASSAHGFIFQNGVLTDLGTFGPPGSSIVPFGVNSSGQVVGIAGPFGSVSDFNGMNFLYQNGSPTVALSFAPFAINDAGQIAGTEGVDFTAASQPALISAKGTFSVLPEPSGVTGGIAFGVSTNGIVAGTVSFGSNISGTSIYGQISAAVWQNGVFQSQKALPVFTAGWASSVNSSGVAAGALIASNDPERGSHAAIFQNGSAIDIGSSIQTQASVATGINDSGWVVGFDGGVAMEEGYQIAGVLSPAISIFRPFLYINGQLYDLNALIPSGSGWTLYTASGINNNNQIVGTGIFQGQPRAYVLTPAPAAPPPPTITSIAGAGLSTPPVQQLTTAGLFSIFGTNFAPAGTSHPLTAADLTNGGTTLPTNMAQTCAQIGTTKIPLTYVGASQINAQASTLPASGNVQVSVIANCGTANETASAPVTVAVAPSAPEFLTFAGTHSVAAVQAASGAYVGKAGLLPGLTFAPAHAGDVLTIFGVSFGPTLSTAPPGVLATGSASTLGAASVTIGGVPVPPQQLLYTGLSPTFSGLYQVNLIVPAGVQPGDQPIVIQVNGGTSPAGTVLTIGQ
jgi:uncharacterized protein (TIGR03437 family)